MGKNDSEFKIFYSWQSDSPEDTNRYFLRNCIDAAAKQAKGILALNVVRDEATRDVPGSPNIVTTLLDKIDKCDLFIADISNCYQHTVLPDKNSPNPNVMFELGYAVKKLGWERIICVLNKTFGKYIPFDISQNRYLDYTLRKDDKKTPKPEIINAILRDIVLLRDRPPVVRDGLATHIVGTYNPEHKKIVSSICPHITQNKIIQCQHKVDNLKTEANSIYNIVTDLTERAGNSDQHDVDLFPSLDKYTTTVLLGSPAINAKENYLKDFERPAKWPSCTIDKVFIEKHINKNIPDNFFDLGSLRIQTLPGSNDKLVGSSSEETKFHKLAELHDCLLEITVREHLICVVKDICFLPFAIQNISSTNDNNISVKICVDTGKIIQPTNILFNALIGLLIQISSTEYNNIDLEFFKNTFCNAIEELFVIPVDEFISTEPDSDPQQLIPNLDEFSPFHVKTYNFNNMVDDCRKKLEEYISTTEKPDFYEFHIDSLRPNECKWLGQGILVQPEGGRIKLSYQIKSEHSNGKLSGSLETDFPFSTESPTANAEKSL